MSPCQKVAPFQRRGIDIGVLERSFVIFISAVCDEWKRNKEVNEVSVCHEVFRVVQLTKTSFISELNSSFLDVLIK